MNWIDTNTFIALCTLAIVITQFILWKYIANKKKYEEEKGKNIATKEDLKELTLIAERAKNEATKEEAGKISYITEKGKNIATKQDIEEITKKIEVIRNEVSFENQRKHAHIEERTNRYLNILHLVEELQCQDYKLLFYLYDKNSKEKLSQLIETSNQILLSLIHEVRVITVSCNDNDVIKVIESLRKSSTEYTVYMCYIASNAIGHLSDWNIFWDLGTEKMHSTENDHCIQFLKKATESMEKLEKIREEYEGNMKEKRDKLYEDIIKYLSVLKSLYDKDFYLKFDF